ncbi:MAG: hypothetical protein NVS3B20_04070 [Polyangiales bacterium]
MQRTGEIYAKIQRRMRAPSLKAGDLIGGRYRLIRPIGEGAMGVVWSARNELTDRDFALKLMLPEAAKHPQGLQRFFREAKASGRLRHRSIIEVYDLGTVEDIPGDPHHPLSGTPYLVMELLEGEPLDALIKRDPPLLPGTIFHILADIARGLDLAHENGIVHRDLKPANIFLHRSPEGPIIPKILDFGISKLADQSFDEVQTSAGTIVGSPAYMSPEQARGEIDIDRRCDIWALGVILYKALTGVLPFTAASQAALARAIDTVNPKSLESHRPDRPPVSSALVHRCLAKERDGRVSTAREFAAAVDDIVRDHDLPAQVLSTIVTSTPTLPLPVAQSDNPNNPISVSPFAATAGAPVTTRVIVDSVVHPSSTLAVSSGLSVGPRIAKRPLLLPAGIIAAFAALIGIVVLGARRDAPPITPPKVAAGLNTPSGRVDGGDPAVSPKSEPFSSRASELTAPTPINVIDVGGKSTPAERAPTAARPSVTNPPRTQAFSASPKLKPKSAPVPEPSSTPVNEGITRPW